MMRNLYCLSLRMYWLFIVVTSIWNNKARKWISGRRQWAQKLRLQTLGLAEKRMWIHCASLGEFEQGRPFIEAFRQKFPDYAICLSFFSPSGFALRKDYAAADLVCYLPLDTRRNAKKFIGIINPTIAVFVKYEFWYNHLHVLHKNSIPHFLLSGIFREKHIFFKPYGLWFRKHLSLFSGLMVQDENSASLLHHAGITNATICGDTRCDRVADAAQAIVRYPELDVFTSNRTVFIAGSIWDADDKIIMDFVQNKSEVRSILVPHEVHERRVNQLVQRFGPHTQVWSDIQKNGLKETTRIIIIDCIGMLMSLYSYATLVYIGGGFGRSIHNTLEPAAHNKPIIIGPSYKKFREAVEMVASGAAFVVNTPAEFMEIASRMTKNNTLTSEAGRKAGEFIKANRGAVDKCFLVLHKFMK